jgi:hypothetical protein
MMRWEVACLDSLRGGAAMSGPRLMLRWADWVSGGGRSLPQQTWSLVNGGAM